MSEDSKTKKSNKGLKALFSVICISIIALGITVYFTTNKDDNDVAKNTTVKETVIETTKEDLTQVQKSVTVKETTTKETQAQTEKETQTKKEQTTMELTDTNTPYKSFYKYPISEVVLNGYTEELVKNDTMQDYRSHTAVDFTGDAGAEVCAINDGIVMDVYNDNMYGYTVVIDHGGKLIAKYCGFDKVNVAKGSIVTIGQKIGTLGKVPCESKMEGHLHLETKLEGKYVNPLDVMGKTE